MGALADPEVTERKARVDAVDLRGSGAAPLANSPAGRVPIGARRLDREARDRGDRLDRAQECELLRDARDEIVGKA